MDSPVPMATLPTTAGFTATTTSNTATNINNTHNETALTQSTVYLYGVLALVGILVAIFAGLLLRSLYVRRRYINSANLAIARGQPLPEYQSPWFARYSPPTTRRKKTKELGPMPQMWEDEMRLVKAVDDDDEKGEPVNHDWTWISPMAIHRIHLPEPLPPPPPPPPTVPQIPSLASEVRDVFYELLPRFRLRRTQSTQLATTPAAPAAPPTTMSAPAVADAPPIGSEVRLGVLIALPCEGMASWSPVDHEEANVPQVCLGLMEAYVVDKDDESTRVYR